MKLNLPSTPKPGNAFPSGDAVKQESAGQKKVRLEELKRQVVDIAERNMDATVRILKDWLDDPKA